MNRVSYNEILNKEGIVRVESQYLRAGAISIAGDHPLAAFSWGVPTLRRGEALIVSDIYHSDLVPPDHVAAMEAIQQVSVIAVPLIKEGEWVGALSVNDTVPRAWKDEDVELARETLERTWAAAQRARAEQALRESKSLLAGQKEAFEAAVEGRPLAEALGILRDTAVKYAGEGGQCRFYLANHETKQLWHVVGMSDEFRECGDGVPIGADQPGCGLAVHTGEPVITPDVLASERWEPWRWLAEKFHFRGVWSFPLKATGGHVVGTFAMYFKDVRDATPRDYEFSSVIAKAAAIIISRHQQAQERERAEERLRESEERLRLVVASVEEYAIFTMDREGRITSWNPGAMRMFGYTAEEAVGQPARIIFTPEDQERGILEGEMRRAREEGHAPDERWYLSKHGARFYVSGMLAPLRDEKGAVTGYAKIARDLTVEKRAEEELQRAHDALEEGVRERTAELLEVNQTLLMEVKERTAAEEHARQLVKQIVTAQEDERRNVARDLHDHLGQQLTGLRLKLQNHKEACAGDEKLSAEVEQIQAIAERLDADVDFLAWELRPASLDELGLTVALANYVQEWSKHFKTAAEFHTTGLDKERLPPEVETNLYRIAQEALNNITKHAGATVVDVILERRDHQAVLIVEDDGKGFDPEALASSPDGKRIGLINMSERASFVGGTLEIESNPGYGTTVFARIPLRSDSPPRTEDMSKEGMPDE